LFTHEIYAKEDTFGISSPSTLEEDHEARQESRHLMNKTPNYMRTEVSTCKSSGAQPENDKPWIARIQALTMKEMMSKPHMKVHTNKESHEKQPRRKLGSNQAKTGLGRPAQPTPSPVRRPLCPRCSSIYCLFRRRPRHRTNHQKTTTEDEGESWMSSS
jgi:hypothetical protein